MKPNASATRIRRLLPHGWIEVQLRDVATCRGGYGFPPREQGQGNRIGSVPFFKVSDMNLAPNSRTMLVANNYVDEPALKRLKVRLFDRDTVIFPKIGAAIGTNKKRILTAPSLVDNNVMGIWSTDRDRLTPDYLYFWLLSVDLRAWSAPGALPSITQHAVLESRALLPPIAEQKEVASVLRAVQDAREATRQAVEATLALKQSLVRHLFTYGTGSVLRAEEVRLAETAAGPIPELWSVLSVGEICEVKGGKRLPKGHAFSSTRTEFPYIRVVDLKNGSVDTGDLRFLTPEDRDVLRRYTISSEDVYISIAGSIGIVGRVPEELDGACLTENAAKLVLKDKRTLLPSFLAAFLASPIGRRQIASFTATTTQPKLALGRIAQIRVAVPPLEEQERIASVLDSLRLRLSALNDRQAALGHLFDSLLNVLLVGHRRLLSAEAA